MDALEPLLNRCSASCLTESTPTSEVLDLLLRAGMRMPDYGDLQPWRFIIVEGEGRTRLSELLSQSTINNGMDPKGIEKTKQGAFRALLIIKVVATAIAKVTYLARGGVGFFRRLRGARHADGGIGAGF